MTTQIAQFDDDERQDRVVSAVYQLLLSLCEDEEYDGSDAAEGQDCPAREAVSEESTCPALAAQEVGS